MFIWLMDTFEPYNTFLEARFEIHLIGKLIALQFIFSKFTKIIVVNYLASF